MNSTPTGSIHFCAGLVSTGAAIFRIRKRNKKRIQVCGRTRTYDQANQFPVVCARWKAAGKDGSLGGHRVRALESATQPSADRSSRWARIGTRSRAEECQPQLCTAWPCCGGILAHVAADRSGPRQTMIMSMIKLLRRPMTGHFKQRLLRVSAQSWGSSCLSEHDGLLCLLRRCCGGNRWPGDGDSDGQRESGCDYRAHGSPEQPPKQRYAAGRAGIHAAAAAAQDRHSPAETRFVTCCLYVS